MGSTGLVDFLRSWTESRAPDLRDEGIAISLIIPDDPSAVAVAVLFAEVEPDLATPDVMGQLALSADGLCLAEVLDPTSGATRHKWAANTDSEAQLAACLNDFLARLRP